jgi:hypothetical protein
MNADISEESQSQKLKDHAGSRGILLTFSVPLYLGIDRYWNLSSAYLIHLGRYKNSAGIVYLDEVIEAE